jgi:hypothetical protein
MVKQLTIFLITTDGFRPTHKPLNRPPKQLKTACHRISTVSEGTFNVLKGFCLSGIECMVLSESSRLHTVDYSAVYGTVLKCQKACRLHATPYIVEV